MTIDEAIADNLRIAEGQDKCAEISVSEHAKERMKVCADKHRLLAAWLKELKELRLTVGMIAELEKVSKAVKHGRWESPVSVGNGIKFCSVCRNEAYWDTDYGQQLFDYCPYCGTRMIKDGERE